MTVHAAKGIEADYVVVRGLSQGKFGFPSEIADDPMLSMVLPESERFPFAEERRLFYVALTRARKRVYLVADVDKPSPFVREILNDSEYVKAVQEGALSSSPTCPHCERGRVARREGRFGSFSGCFNYPLCEYRGSVCPRCSAGVMVVHGKEETCCGACDFMTRLCPRCQLGMLVKRHAKGSGHDFWGCSRFGRLSNSCNYTEKVARPAT